MAHSDMFNWQDGALLFAGAEPVARPFGIKPIGFRSIPAQPTLAALTSLADAVLAGDSFCISQTPLPKRCETSPPDFLTLTGGSTGSPKIIHRSQASWIASFEINSATFKMSALGSLAVLGRLSHSLALYGVLEGLHVGLHVHALDEFSPKQQFKVLRDNKINVLYATPTQMRLLAMASAAHLPDIRRIFIGGGALDASTASSVRRLCPNADLRQFYGAAEASFITMTDDETPAGSVGRPFPGVEIKAEDGEIWVRSPYLFKGYATVSDAQTRWADGYLSVGELGRMDDLGNLWITGRKSRLINIADQLVSPEVLENHVMQLPQGGFCAALPVPDSSRGNRLALIVQGAGDPDRAQAIKDSCRAEFGALIGPRSIYFLPKLPLLPSGKPDLENLSHWLEKQT